MPAKQILFDPKNLLNLIIHYMDSDAAVPMDAEVVGFGVHEKLKGYLGLVVKGEGWQTPDNGPIHVRAEGKRMMMFQKGPDQVPLWTDANDDPRRQK